MNQGRIQDFKLGGALKINRAERREARTFLGYFVCKITILRKIIIFFPILGGGVRRVRPPWIRPCYINWKLVEKYLLNQTISMYLFDELHK